MLRIWGSQTPAEAIQERLGTIGVDAVVTSLEQAVQLLAVEAAPELVAQPAAIRR